MLNEKKRMEVALAAITVCVLVVCCAVVWAGPNMVTMPQIATASTNATASDGDSVTNQLATPLYGYVYAVVIDLGGFASPTVDVDIVTIGGTGSGPSRTIFTTNDMLGDGIFYPSVPAQDTGGTTISSTDARFIPLVHDNIRASVYANDTTGAVSANVYIILK